MRTVPAVRRPSSDPPPLEHWLGPLRRTILGQEEVLRKIAVGLVAGGHILLEGPPGVAKTRIARSVAALFEMTFRRIQLTPDLLPADLTGSLVFREERGDFALSPGPLFAHFVLADELNRAPPKVQSALLEAMEEGQVTLGNRSHPLPEPFVVFATQNPQEEEGTYPLPQAQLDRFLMRIAVPYPDRTGEVQILRSELDDASPGIPSMGDSGEILEVRDAATRLRLDDRIVEYAADLVRCSRQPSPGPGETITAYVRHGVSPRAGILLLRAARARAYLLGRSYVLPEDVKTLAGPVLSHRIGLTFAAEAEGVAGEDVVSALLDAGPLP